MDLLKIEKKGCNPMKIKSTIIVILAGTIVLSLAACSGINPVKSDPLEGTSWVLTAYRKSRPIPETSITATFEEGRVHGSAGCNSYSGSYQVGNGTIEVGAIAITEMACLGPEGIMEQETMFINEFLREAQTFQVTDDQLQIFRSDREALTFIPQE
jgi:heat shock protein HslJ